MSYVLDTNICIYIINKKKPKNVLEILKRKKISSIGISTITLNELEYGIVKSRAPEKNRLALLEFIAPLKIYNYDDMVAKITLNSGLIWKRLEKLSGLWIC